MATSKMRSASTELNGCPFFVGITGKRDLQGQDAAVRLALDAAFDLLDRRMPHTPKVLLSSLAAGADTIAAEAAVGRQGWTILAPLPFTAEVYEADFPDPSDAERLHALMAHPRVRVLELCPLRRAGSGRRYVPREIARTTPSSTARTLHYEQAGLYIVERCGILIGVVGSDETPGRVGGAGRILNARLNGLDATALAIRRHSSELLQEGGLADPRSGPVWRILLEPERLAAGTTLGLWVQTDRDAKPAPIKNRALLEESLELGLKLDGFNRRADELGAEALSLAREGVSRLAGLRRSLSHVQRRMKRRVTWAIWAIAALFAGAVLSLETHVAFGDYRWAGPLTIPYFLTAAGAMGLYLLARAGQWQPLAEDYRAISEALRMQMVLWQSGITGPDSRVDTQYLRGKRGSLAIVRELIGHFVEGARLWTTPPAKDPQAADVWVENQISYFTRRIGERHASVELTRATSWFLFAIGLVLSATLAGMQIAPFEHLVAELAAGPWSAGGRWLTLGACTLLVVLCFFGAQTAQRKAEAASAASRALKLYRLAALGAAASGGLLTALALFNAAALLPGHSDPEATLHRVEEQLIYIAVMSTTLAGSIRFVSAKLSWEAELEGYEQALNFFKRARQALATESAFPADRERLVRELVSEALQENEAWLMAHRERPLEPVMGG